MRFSIHGPFDVPVRTNNGRHVDNLALDDWWDDGTDLCSSQGCYVFAMRHGRGITPVYVGMTARQSFEGECFSPANRLKLGEILGQHGTLVLFLIKEERTRRSSPRAIRELEQYLIGVAADRNPNLLNLRGTTKPSWELDGIGPGRGSGRRPRPVTEFAKMFGL